MQRLFIYYGLFQSVLIILLNTQKGVDYMTNYIDNGIIKVGLFIYFTIIEMLEFCRIAVAVFDMAAHDMKNDKILFIGVYSLQKLQ